MAGRMKCLSVKQPWAGLIATGRKRVELRTWRTDYRGPLVIVSSLGAAQRHLLDHWGDGPRGVTLAIVELLDVRPATLSDVRAACLKPAEGVFAWLLAHPRLTPHIKVRGQLSLYAPPDELRATLQSMW